MTTSEFTASPHAFADVLEANARYAAQFPYRGLEGTASRGLLVLTCMDTRIDPSAILGLQPGDAKILRNAGARVTDEVLATAVVSVYLLGVRRIMVMAHTRCRMASGSPDDVHAAIAEAGGPDTRSLEFRTTTDQLESLRRDVQRIRSWPYLAHATDLAIGGFRYDVDTGRVEFVC
ncbi:MAG: carbonic anhydrase [Acidothermus sp.]|nr:carbonic anhydrase [Acidothermus sp.]MCL6538067.1 carbonic anhydrase [Acidothermus sp.]